MKLMRVVVSLLAAAGPAAAQTNAAVEAAPAAHAIVVLPHGVEWQPAPASLESGARVAVLEGDPSKPGPFTMRLWLPAGIGSRRTCIRRTSA